MCGDAARGGKASGDGERTRLRICRENVSENRGKSGCNLNCSVVLLL